jgi:peptidyl-prolyl cis-trans isomerase SDCCAG10
VLLVTTHGEIAIDLWSKETPRACRNFIQLCLEGYYDRTLFHRIVKGFMVQGGDPTGTGQGGQSIYGAPFLDEFHSRLKFSHRGIVAMANPGAVNMNESQFFMTVDACPWLDRKHTVFGKIEGQTIFNLLAISELETDSNERPVNLPLPMIIRAEVIENPYDDIEPRATTKQAISVPNLTPKAAPAVKNKSLISFNEEDGEEPVMLPKRGIRSMHEANGKGMSTEAAVSQAELEAARRKRELLEKSKEELK